MRLTNKQIQDIILSLTSYISNEHAELRLYGSRVNDSLKGGDIDLLLLVENARFIIELGEKKHYILAAIKKRLGDQKIDLLIADKNNIHEDSFIKMIFPNSISLKTWPI